MFLKNIFGEKEKKKIRKKVSRKFIPTTTLHGASGNISKMTIDRKSDGYTRVWGSARMFNYLKSFSFENVGIDWTFGKNTPPEKIDVKKEKGEVILK